MEINAPWEETPIIYCLLDANNNVQYVRVQHTYQNDINTTVDQAAKIKDSLYFDSLQVIIRGSDGSIASFKKTDTIPKDLGYFATDGHVLYQASMNLNTGLSYTLEVFSPQSGKTYKATTQIVRPSPIGLDGQIGGTPDSMFIRPYLNSNQVVHNFTPNYSAVVYDILLRFNYKEYPVGNPAAAKFYFIDYDFINNWVPNVVNQKRSTVPSRNWINYLKATLLLNNSVVREFVSAEYVAAGASQDLFNAYNITIPSPSSVQKRTDYTNIPNALGIFSSRSITKEIGPLRNRPADNGVDSSKIYLVKDLPNFIY